MIRPLKGHRSRRYYGLPLNVRNTSGCGALFFAKPEEEEAPVPIIKKTRGFLENQAEAHKMKSFSIELNLIGQNFDNGEIAVAFEVDLSIGECCTLSRADHSNVCDRPGRRRDRADRSHLIPGVDTIARKKTIDLSLFQERPTCRVFGKAMQVSSDQVGAEGDLFQVTALFIAQVTECPR